MSEPCTDLDRRGRQQMILNGLRNRRPGSSAVPRRRLEGGNDVVRDRGGQPRPVLIRHRRMPQHPLVVHRSRTTLSTATHSLSTATRAQSAGPARLACDWSRISTMASTDRIERSPCLPSTSITRGQTGAGEVAPGHSALTVPSRAAIRAIPKLTVRRRSCRGGIMVQ